jgi:pimeloyl-ACP methyl ester carboxylesterase
MVPSSWQATDYSLGAFAVSLRDLLDELGITRATVVGQSLGGGVAMQFVYQHRDYCERLAPFSGSNVVRRDTGLGAARPPLFGAPCYNVV